MTYAIGNQTCTKDELISRYQSIGNLEGRAAAWVRRDLTTCSSTSMGRLIWSFLIKWVPYFREFFLQVNLEQSKRSLDSLKGQVLLDPGLIELHNLAVERFNTLFPRHKAEKIFVAPAPVTPPRGRPPLFPDTPETSKRNRGSPVSPSPIWRRIVERSQDESQVMISLDGEESQDESEVTIFLDAKGDREESKVMISLDIEEAPGNLVRESSKKGPAKPFQSPLRYLKERKNRDNTTDHLRTYSLGQKKFESPETTRSKKENALYWEGIHV